jgi:hypothetical protein
MKFLSVPRLQKLSSLLESLDIGDTILHCKIEAYSCKLAGVDKQIGKQIEKSIQKQLSTSPQLQAANSPLGPITNSNTRKLLISLITTMNASFLDYDFTNLQPEQFSVEPHSELVINYINNLWLNQYESLNPGIKAEFWAAINETIELNDCEIYSYTPDLDSELSSGKLFIVNYFFYNKKAKKILFLRSHGVSKLHAINSINDEDEMSENVENSAENSDFEISEGEFDSAEDNMSQFELENLDNNNNISNNNENNNISSKMDESKDQAAINASRARRDRSAAHQQANASAQKQRKKRAVDTQKAAKKGKTKQKGKSKAQISANNASNSDNMALATPNEAHNVEKPLKLRSYVPRDPTLLSSAAILPTHSSTVEFIDSQLKSTIASALNDSNTDVLLEIVPAEPNSDLKRMLQPSLDELHIKTQQKIRELVQEKMQQ